MAAPFINEKFNFIQPDGTSLEVLGTGDQFSARFTTLDGTPLVRNNQGYYVAHDAELLAAPVELEHKSGLKPRRNRWEIRRRAIRRKPIRPEESNFALAPPERQTLGAIVGLTLLVEFPDVPATIPVAEVDRFCNAIGYSGNGNNGSVRDYFAEISCNRLNYTNVVAPYYVAQNPRRYYTDPSQPYGARAQELIREALRFHISNGFNFAQLSADGSGFIYALNLFYAGTRVNSWGQGLWPHQSSLATPIALPDGRKFADYQICDMADKLTLGTFCHENGHMVCDFPDLYRYTGSGTGVGVFCLMCYGGTGSNATNPAHVNAYLKAEAGWGNVTAAVSGTTNVLHAGNNDFLVHTRLNEPREYFIIENRLKSGRDAGLPRGGLAIWYVDERASNTNPAPVYECELLQADGLQDLQFGRNNGDATDLFPLATITSFSHATLPSSAWRDNTLSGLDIKRIGAPGAGLTVQL